MDVIITWGFAVALAAILFWPRWKARSNADDASTTPPRHADVARTPPPRGPVASVFASFDVQDWGLFVGAAGFLVAAVVGTTGALL